jgi:hypothetical protein
MAEKIDEYHVVQNLNFGFFNKIKNLKSSFTDVFKCYVETDASGAKTVHSLSPHFKEVHSVQLDSKVKEKLIENRISDKINYYSNSGSSLTALKNICKNVLYNPVFYFNYNNYSKDSDCLVQDYVSGINSVCKNQCIIIIDSFGLINNCFKVAEDISYVSELQKKIEGRCGKRLTNSYTVGATAGGRYRLVLHLDKKPE